MKKILIFSFLILVCCSCKNNKMNDKKISKRQIFCNNSDNEFILNLENGQIVSYIDSIDGDLGDEIVNILNEEHLVGVSDNDKALKIMNDVLIQNGGSCK